MSRWLNLPGGEPSPGVHESRIVRPDRSEILYSMTWSMPLRPEWPDELRIGLDGPIDIEERALPDGEWETVATSPDGFRKLAFIRDGILLCADPADPRNGTRWAGAPSA